MGWEDYVSGPPKPHTGKVQLRIDIECGEKTCAAEPGKLCRFVGTMMFGTVNVCMLFPDHSDHHAASLRVHGHTILEDKDGWLQRCPQCLENGHVI